MPTDLPKRPALDGASATAGLDGPPPLVSAVPVVRWVCCHCGGTGLAWDGATCPACCGHGHD